MKFEGNLNIVISGTDYYIGNTVAYDLCHRMPQKVHELRVLCEPGNEQRVGHLRNCNANVFAMDVTSDSNQHRLENQVFHDCDWLIIAPPSTQHRVKECQRLLEVAKKVGVKNVLLVSIVGAEGNGQNLKEFKEIESLVQREYQQHQYCIVRSQFPIQDMLLWSPMIHEQRQWALPIPSDQKFSPVDVNDVCRTIAQICSEKNMDRTHIKQLYTLTGPEALTPPDINQRLCKGAGKSHNEINYKEATRKEVESYLSSLRNHPQYTADITSQSTQQLEGGNQGRFKHRKPFMPDMCEVNTLCDFFDFCKTGQAGFVTEDINKITGKGAVKIDMFFAENSKEFAL